MGIFSAALAGVSMLPKQEAVLEARRGLVGDRYYLGTGTFSEKLKGTPDVQLTLIALEEIEGFNERHGLDLGPGDFRRNVVTRGIELNELVGHQFNIGVTVLEGIRLCEPCAHLAGRVHPQVLPGLVHRAGLRAAVLSGGTIRAGDAVTLRT